MHFNRDTIESFGAVHSNDAATWNQFQIALDQVPFDASARCREEDLSHVFAVNGLGNFCEEFHRNYARFIGESEMSGAVEADRVTSV